LDDMTAARSKPPPEPEPEPERALAPEPEAMHLGRVIAATLEQKGMTQEDLANKLGVNQSTVARWVTGENKPKGSNLVAVADLCGLTVEEAFLLKYQTTGPMSLPMVEQRVSRLEAKAEELVEQLTEVVAQLRVLNRAVGAPNAAAAPAKARRSR
jgi:transcriptional regulator with XRE-family HTH domain